MWIPERFGSMNKRMKCLLPWMVTFQNNVKADSIKPALRLLSFEKKGKGIIVVVVVNLLYCGVVVV
jgi:hypothetical protein